MRGREWAAVASVCLGLILLALSAGAERAGSVPTSTKWGPLIGVSAVTSLGYRVGALKVKHGPQPDRDVAR